MFCSHTFGITLKKNNESFILVSEDKIRKILEQPSPAKLLSIYTFIRYSKKQIIPFCHIASELMIDDEDVKNLVDELVTLEIIPALENQSAIKRI